MQRFEKTIGENLILLEFLYSAKILLKCEGKNSKIFQAHTRSENIPLAHTFL